MSEIRFYIDKNACKIYKSPVALIPNTKTYESFDKAKKMLIAEYTNEMMLIMSRIEEAKELDSYLSIDISKTKV